MGDRVTTETELREAGLVEGALRAAGFEFTREDETFVITAGDITATIDRRTGRVTSESVEMPKKFGLLRQHYAEAKYRAECERQGITGEIAPIVHVRLHHEVFDDVGCAPDGIGVLMRDPEQVDRPTPKIRSQLAHEVRVGARTDGAAAGPLRRVPRVHEDVPTVGQIHERGEGLAHVVEVDPEPPAATGSSARWRHGLHAHRGGRRW
jgi:hypothetical protein